MSLSKKDIEYLDSIPDYKFLFWIWSKYGTEVPQWKRVTKKEYERHCVKLDGILTISKLEKVLKSQVFRAVPYWNNGGGILDQISGKEPDGYYYEKCIGYNKVLQLGSDLFEYCKTRECMKMYFKE